MTVAPDPWQEQPVRGGYPHPSFLSLSGLERQQRFREFSLPPPIHFLTGSSPTDSGPGEGAAVMPATGWLLSPQGRIPLGALAVLADLAFGISAGSNLMPGAGFTTAELSLTRLGTPRLGGNLIGHGRMLHTSSTMGLSEAKVFDSDGRLVAAGTSRLAMFAPLPDLPPVPDPPPTPDEPAYDSPHPFEREPQGAVVDEGEWQHLSGLDVLRRHASGDLPLPPLGRLTGLRVAGADEGRATVVLPCSEWLATPAGTVQGGFTAMICDAAIQCAIQTTVEAGHGFAPLDVKVNYLRPVRPDGRLLTAEAEVTHRGRSLAIGHVTVTDADGKKVALGTGSASLGGADLL